MKRTWHRSEHIGHQNIDKNVIECVIGLADVLLQRLNSAYDDHHFYR